MIDRVLLRIVAVVRTNKMKVLLCVTVAVLVCGALAKNKKSEDNKVKIALYYESLCPDSKRFITEQLAPVWRDFKGSVKVKLVPYGKSTHDKVNGKWQFNCHHGPDECYGNKVQACILKDKVLADTEKMDLVICLMGQASPDKSLDTCLEKINKLSESTKLKQCASGTQGDNLLAGYGDKTDGVQRPLAFVPTIVVNEKFSQENQDAAFTNLKSVICRVATGTKPSAC
ncbi:GILT-like protein 1 [Cydia fagiglandana]|uniref:GILT-like protein 1 n=1 Tax=Cydia fagiglandana TaxID=1458189 RepID=UPI002FEDEC1B